MADWSEPLETHLSTEEIYRQRLIAQRLAEGETEYPDNTYEEGVLDTINWIVSLGHAAPLDEEIYGQDDEDDQ